MYIRLTRRFLRIGLYTFPFLSLSAWRAFHAGVVDCRSDVTDHFEDYDLLECHDSGRDLACKALRLD